MSNPLAIAAVTATLRHLLEVGIAADPELNDITVTMQPLDLARTKNNHANQMNVFLYHVLPSGAWRNADIPGRVRPGETANFPLGLNLYYLLTAFGKENDSTRPFSHQVMGRAMSVLNDHPLLGAAEIQNALPNNDLWNQVERVRFTLQPFSVEEVAKLWTGFQTQYRLSVAYEAAVVLIDSARPITTPLPVLMRGEKDSGIVAQANLIPPYPALSQILLIDPTLPDPTQSNQQRTAKLGDTVTLLGQHLDGDQVNVQFSPLRLPAPEKVPAQKGGTSTLVQVVIPNNAPDKWPAGIYNVQVLVTSNQQDLPLTNALPLAIAPQIVGKLPLKVKQPANINLTCAAPVQPSQMVSLLVGSQEVPADPHPAAATKLSFASTALTTGTFPIRLRVDGVDSQLIVYTAGKPTGFDANQSVTIS
jgi:hypothetical protein